jgi:peptidoglycan/LPS O-acetylase OafA/YrhL
LWGSSSTLLFHTWTLALEEQFYLVWPPLLLLALAIRRCGRMLRWVGYAALIVGSGGLLLVLAHALGLTSYLRATGLLLGCALAIAMNGRAFRLPPWLGLTSCLLLIAVTFWPLTLPGGIFQNGYSPTALLTVPAIVATTDGASAATRALSWRPMIWVGRRSYGIYLWHFPILALAINQAPQAIPAPARIVGGIVAMVVIAALSYRFVELPFLRLKNRYSPGLRLRTSPSSKSKPVGMHSPSGLPEPEARATT